MKKQVIQAGLVFCLVAAGQVPAGILNEWKFQADPAGLTLSESTNSGMDRAVFAAGGAGFLETDGAGNLLSTHAGGGTNGMWTSGAILDADVTNVVSGAQYLRCDFNYNLADFRHEGGTVLGLGVTDGSGTNVAGVVFTCDWGGTAVPADRTLAPVVTNLHSIGSLSMIVKVDMDARTLSAWYDLSGTNQFDESSPAISNIPINLTSIDRLQFQATGDFQPAGSADYASVDNIRTASTWEDIAAAISAPFTVHALFHDRMVLQRDMDAPVWGYATPGTEVTVKLDGIPIGTATADANGKWLARISPQSNDGGVSHEMVISSSNGDADIQINDVVFGDVYIASGQSNMDNTMKSITNGYYLDEPALADAYSLIRQMRIAKISSTNEWEEPVFGYGGWLECSSASLPNFSATAYFFAKHVYLSSGVPVGLLLNAWGGQSIERFLCPQGLAAVPELAGMLQYQEQGGITNLYDIYNSMVAPLIPYGVRGAIWYQGENNSNEEDIYKYKMQALIRGWRQNWGQGDFSFYYVQLPNFDTANKWPEFRDAQTRVLSETNTGMAVTIDIGDDGHFAPNSIHPNDKFDTGYRLAQWTLAKDMHHDIVYSSPLYRSAGVEGSQIRVLFDDAEDGLMTGWKDGTNPVVEVAGSLQNFEIAGSDKTFVSATAVIDRNSVIVSNSTVSAPVYVRYCYANAPSGTNKLYNAAGLPASPFRTDADYRLDVKSGSGTAAKLVPGTQVVITATAPAGGKIFDRWIGAASEVDDLNASTATVTMPDHSLYLLATYRGSSAPAYTLTVNNGFGSGTSQSGSILNIEAAVPASGQLFDHWSGDTQEVVNVYASTTTLRMPTNDVTVTAVYRTEDSVGDGIPDAWRVTYFGGDGSTTNADSASGADPDGDGMSNLQEYRAGTSPVDARSVLQLHGAFSGSVASLNFQSVGGRRYRLERTDSLTAPAWEPLLYNISGNGLQKYAAFSTATSSSGFYRLRLTE